MDLPEEQAVLYIVENLDVSMDDVLDEITVGLNEMKAGGKGSGFEGGIVMLLRIPATWAEIVESAAERNGLVLSQVVGEEEP